MSFLYLGDVVSGNDEDSSFRIAMNLWPGYSHHTFLALDNYFFKDEGVNVEVNLFDDYIDSLEAFKDGRFDAVFAAYSDAILLASEGYPVSVVYVADFSNGGDVVMSSSEVKSISDLKGKTVGVGQLNSFSHLFILDLLRRNGVSEDDVNIVDVGGPDVLAGLRSGYIDAGHTMEPFQSEALAEGYNLLASSADVPNSIVDVLVVNKEVVEKNPDEVRGVVNALFRSERYLVKYPDKSNSYISLKTGVNSFELKEELKGIKILSEEDNKNIFDKGSKNSLYENGKFISDFFIEKSIIAEPVDLEELIDSRFVLG